jgi:hypothetical protein
MISAREWLETAHETRNGDERKLMEIRAQRIDGAVPQSPDTGRAKIDGLRYNSGARQSACIAR